jgi:FkbM family methyltransferase
MTKTLFRRTVDGLRLTACGVLAKVWATHTTRWYERRARFLKRRGEIQEITLAGKPGRFHLRTLGDYEHLCEEWFETEHILAFLEHLRPDDVVYEVGGHIGSWTIFLAQAVPLGKVCVFEPEPVNCRALRENVALNDLRNVVIQPVAAGNVTGTAELNIRGAYDGSGRHSLKVHGENGRAIPVPVERLDEAGARLNLPPPTAVKVDCEGAEIEVLEGMRGLLDSGSIRLMHLEVHNSLLEQCGQSGKVVHDTLRDRGYETLRSVRRGFETQLLVGKKS